MSKREKKMKKERKPIDKRRVLYKGLVAGLLMLISGIALMAFWYELYLDLMPVINAFLFGYVGGANAFDVVSTDMYPYTMVALWGIPTLLLCATLNVLWWKISKVFIKGMKKAYGFFIRKFDDNSAKVKAEKERAAK